MTKKKPQRVAYRDAKGHFISKAAWLRQQARQAAKREAARQERQRLARLAARRQARLAAKRPAKKKPEPTPKKIAKAVRPAIRAKLLPKGTEFELTATTKGGSPKGGKRTVDPRRLHLKIRVVIRRAMTADTARALLHRAITERRVPPGIDIQGIDWSKGSERGSSAESINRQLRKFYGAMMGGTTRFARVVE